MNKLSIMGFTRYVMGFFKGKPSSQDRAVLFLLNEGLDQLPNTDL